MVFDQIESSHKSDLFPEKTFFSSCVHNMFWVIIYYPWVWLGYGVGKPQSLMLLWLRYVKYTFYNYFTLPKQVGETATLYTQSFFFNISILRIAARGAIKKSQYINIFRLSRVKDNIPKMSFSLWLMVLIIDSNSEQRTHYRK